MGSSKFVCRRENQWMNVHSHRYIKGSVYLVIHQKVLEVCLLPGPRGQALSGSSWWILWWRCFHLWWTWLSLAGCPRVEPNVPVGKAEETTLKDRRLVAVWLVFSFYYHFLTFWFKFRAKIHQVTESDAPPDSRAVPTHSPPPLPSCGGRRPADVDPCRWCKTSCRCGSSWCCRWGLGGRPLRWEVLLFPRSRWWPGYRCLECGRVRQEKYINILCHPDYERSVFTSIKSKTEGICFRCVCLWTVPAERRMLRVVGCQLTMPTRLECPSRTTMGSDRGRVRVWSGICHTWRGHTNTVLLILLYSRCCFFFFLLVLNIWDQRGKKTFFKSK